MNLGQLFISGISGLFLTAEEKKNIREKNLSGIILFANNYEDSAQLIELINSIIELKERDPFFICVDHEGGRVQRFKKGFTHFPAMFDIAKKTKSPKKVFEVHSIMGKELRAHGINLNLAPCADIWTNKNNTVIGDRSFGNEADTVEKFTSAAIRGLHTQDILSCAKHFPGHGMTLEDSHYDLPVVKKSLNELREEELIPFKKAVRAKIQLMMMAHLQIPELDSDKPTTLSKRAYEFLREETGFQNIIISDDMVMKAITDHYSFGEAATMALQAGCDLLEYRNMEAALEALNGVEESYQQGEFDEQQLQEKLKRIAQVKKSFLSKQKPLEPSKLEKLFLKEDHEKFLTDLLAD